MHLGWTGEVCGLTGLVQDHRHIVCVPLHRHSEEALAQYRFVERTSHLQSYLGHNPPRRQSDSHPVPSVKRHIATLEDGET